jgi:glycosyltransferase involved in cell wall biosynthesis
MEVTFTTFNYGNAGRFANGPGMCLVNLVKFLKQNTDIKVNVFTFLKSNFYEAENIQNKDKLLSAIKRSDVLNHWSGIDLSIFFDSIRLANELNKKVIIGPNIIDTVNFDKEKTFLEKIKFDRVLTVNQRFKFLLSRVHNINPEKIKLLLVGPDPYLWSPVGSNDGTILWKGNSGQKVKDVSFALLLKEKLPQYKFKFIGYPQPFDYFDHISEAKKSKLLIATSLSETMGLGVLEAWMSGVPSVSHPKIYMHGENYKTGIITNKTIEDYSEAIIEIMEDDALYKNLYLGTMEYMEDKFSPKIICDNYLKICNEI